MIFLKEWCRLQVGTGIPSSGFRIPSSFSSVISAKGNENPPSLTKRFCSRNMRNTPARDHSVFVSCWASLLRFLSRFLAGPSLPRMGIRPAFLCSGSIFERDLRPNYLNLGDASYAKSQTSSEAAMHQFDCPSRQYFFSSAGNQYSRLVASFPFMRSFISKLGGPLSGGVQDE